MLSGICEHIDKAVMAPATSMPCITHRIYAIDFQLILLHANETHVHLLDGRLLYLTYNITAWVYRGLNRVSKSTSALSLHQSIV